MARTPARLARRVHHTSRVRHLPLPPTPFDVRIRRLAQSAALDPLRTALAPLFPIGLPIGYLSIAYATRQWLHRRGARGGRAIVTSAWLGWLVHRAAVHAFIRERPHRPRVRRRTDSFPSGHTTGATSLALAAAYVLHRQHLISPRRAIAIAVGAPAIMGAYRVIDDEHWVTDVVGGWLLGAAIAASCVLTVGAPWDRRPIRAPATRPSASPRRDRREPPTPSA